MSDYTIDDSMAKIIYEISDREIYNDVRAEIGVQHLETVVDEDPMYSWKYFGTSWCRLDSSGCRLTTYTVPADNALVWQLLADHSANIVEPDAPDLYEPYYDYTIAIVTSDSGHCVVKTCNTGSRLAHLSYRVRYKYKSSDGSTHEEIVYQTLTVRVTDDDSIAKYGRRVMNLTWPQGTSREGMQMIANACLARYKEPVPNLMVSMQGKDDTIATEIFTREISDTISVICDNLGMASTDFFLDKISIRDSGVKVPVCNWLLTGQRAEEATGYFIIDTDFIDGDKLIG